PLTALATTALTRALGTESQDDLKPLQADMAWYEAHRRSLLRRYAGEYLAIVERRVLDHDADFNALAARVFAKVGVRPIFMPQCLATDHVVHLRSPRRVPAYVPRYRYSRQYTLPGHVLPVRVGLPGPRPEAIG